MGKSTLKKILIVANDSPYPIESGANKRTLDISLYLSKFYSVDLLIPNYSNRNSRELSIHEKDFLCDNFNKVYYFDTVKKKINIFNKIVKRMQKYLFMEKHLASKMFKRIQNNYNYIIFSELYFLDLLQEKLNAKIILDAMVSYYPHTLETSRKNTVSLLHQIWIKKYENSMVNNVDLILTITEQDANYYKKYNKKIVNCKIPVVDKFSSLRKKEYDFIFIGVNNTINQESIDYFDSKILPYLANNIKIKIVVFGEISQYEKLKKSKYKSNYILINSGSKEEYFNKSKISLSLIFKGKGLQTKVLEGLSFRHVVVLTNKSNIGINLTDNEAIISDDSYKIIQKINKLLIDENLYYQMSDASYRFSIKYFSPKFIYNDLLEYIDND